MIEVLDKGYVRLVDHMGSDLSVVNAARVSYDKESDSFSDRDGKLVNFLLKHGHNSPLRHAAIALEAYAPLFVARQWFKYSVSSAHIDDQNGWNESSRRYVTEEPTFYIPEADEWRSAPENSKQGSGAPLPTAQGHQLTQWLIDAVDEGVRKYEHAMDMGVAPEQARLFIPAYGLYVRWRWTASLQSILHFLDQRLEHDAQKEIQDYAKAVKEIVQPLYPYTFAAWEQKKERERELVG